MKENLSGGVRPNAAVVVVMIWTTSRVIIFARCVEGLSRQATRSDVMTVKEQLRQIEINRGLIFRKQQQIQSLYEILSSMGIDTTKEVVFSCAEDKMANLVTRIVTLKEELEEERVNAEEEKRKIIGCINKVSDSTLQRVLYMRYVELKSLLEISQKIGYSYDWTRHLHTKALAEFEKIAKNTTQHTKTH